MNVYVRFAAGIVFVAVAGGVAPALADTADAHCTVSKEGETKQGASGPCTYSQRQGYIDLDLRNGDTYSLSPGEKAGHYKDQKGIKVVRTSAGGDSQTFQWEGGKKVVVTFTGASTAKHSAQPNYESGASAADLADLVGAKGGQAEGELQRRGYKFHAADGEYSTWWNKDSRRCVTIRTVDGRYKSIVDTMPFDCGKN